MLQAMLARCNITEHNKGLSVAEENMRRNAADARELQRSERPKTAPDSTRITAPADPKQPSITGEPMNPPCTRTCLEMAIGATCPDCGHNTVLHPGPADVPHCTHCELENLIAELKAQQQ